MKEFRIARCLDDSKNGIPVIRKYAIFKDGTPRCIIETDDEGREYFDIQNWIQSEPEMDEFNYRDSLRKYTKYSFSGKPADMIESIRRGYGDVISSMLLGGRIESVRYYLDREYGESLRQKTLDKWKDAKYGYVLYYNCIPINVHTGKKDFDRKNVFFDSVQSAIDMANSVIHNAVIKAMDLVDCVYMEDACYLAFMDDYLNPIVDLLFEQFEPIYDEGDIFIYKEDVSPEILLRKFIIRQEVVEEE